MKKIFYSTVVVVGVFLFTGCIATTDISGISKSTKYKLGKEDGSYVVFSDHKSILSTSTVSDYKNYLYTQLNIAARETKRMGYNYFVMTNSNANNLNGFPLNNASNLLRYMTLKTRKPSFATDLIDKNPKSLISSGEMLLRFKPVSDSVGSNGLISVWSVEQTLIDTQ